MPRADGPLPTQLKPFRHVVHAFSTGQSAYLGPLPDAAVLVTTHCRHSLVRANVRR